MAQWFLSLSVYANITRVKHLGFKGFAFGIIFNSNHLTMHDSYSCTETEHLGDIDLFL